MLLQVGFFCGVEKSSPFETLSHFVFCYLDLYLFSVQYFPADDMKTAGSCVEVLLLLFTAGHTPGHPGVHMISGCDCQSQSNDLRYVYAVLNGVNIILMRLHVVCSAPQPLVILLKNNQLNSPWGSLCSDVTSLSIPQCKASLKHRFIDISEATTASVYTFF